MEEELIFICPLGTSIVAAENIYDDVTMDRKWKFMCGRVVDSAMDSSWQCSKEFTAPVHKPFEAMSYHCPQNSFLVGVKSYWDFDYLDRIWSFKCCRVPGYVTLGCRITGYLNNWHTDLQYFEVGAGRVITGMFSYYREGHL